MLPIEDGDGEMEMKRQLLEELSQLASGGMAGEMRQRYGKPPREEPGMGEEMPPEDPEIPGVEAAEPWVGGGEQKLDPEMLMAVLAKMKGGG